MVRDVGWVPYSLNNYFMYNHILGEITRSFPYISRAIILKSPWDLKSPVGKFVITRGKIYPEIIPRFDVKYINKRRICIALIDVIIYNSVI